jgi:hypothetical protein
MKLNNRLLDLTPKAFQPISGSISHFDPTLSFQDFKDLDPLTGFSKSFPLMQIFEISLIRPGLYSPELFPTSPITRNLQIDGIEGHQELGVIDFWLYQRFSSRVFQSKKFEKLRPGLQNDLSPLVS